MCWPLKSWMAEQARYKKPQNDTLDIHEMFAGYSNGKWANMRVKTWAVTRF